MTSSNSALYFIRKLRQNYAPSCKSLEHKSHNTYSDLSDSEVNPILLDLVGSTDGSEEVKFNAH